MTTATIQLIDRLRSIVGATNIIANESELLVFECDGYVVEKQAPDLVVFPTTTEQDRRDCQSLQRGGHPVCSARSGDVTGRRELYQSAEES